MTILSALGAIQLWAWLIYFVSHESEGFPFLFCFFLFSLCESRSSFLVLFAEKVWDGSIIFCFASFMLLPCFGFLWCFYFFNVINIYLDTYHIIYTISLSILVLLLITFVKCVLHSLTISMSLQNYSSYCTLKQLLHFKQELLSKYQNGKHSTMLQYISIIL